MRKSLITRFYFFVPLLFLSLAMVSCSSQKKIKYFQDIPDSGKLKTIVNANYTPPTIQVDDIITVIVETVDPANTAVINLGNIPVASTGTSLGGSNSLSSLAGSSQQATSGYLVDKDGYITVPILGKMKLSGYTTSEATDIVRNVALKYYKDPTVIVRYANFKISVTGEVLKPGVYVMPNEKVSILDAIAVAGDLTVFGKRENVLLIRENPDGTKTPYRINLKKSDIMSAPYYYLRQNDIIYVEPRKAKSDATDAAQQKYVTIAGALLSIILVLAYRAK
jgi:polysaccharide biosynthesis/export protein